MSSNKEEVLKAAIAQISANRDKLGAGEDIYKGRIEIELIRWVNLAKLYGVEIPTALENDMDIVKMLSTSSFPLPKRFSVGESRNHLPKEEIDPYRFDTRRGIGGYPKND